MRTVAVVNLSHLVIISVSF